jgi:hypothetical protein
MAITNNWISRVSAADRPWRSVTYGNGLYVSVSEVDGLQPTSNRIMTSPDGITWTLRTGTSYNNLYSVTFGNGIFVAVGAADIITSSDGITWTLRTGTGNVWFSVTFGNGLFVASGSNFGAPIMTSPNGITWTGRPVLGVSRLECVAYGNGLFVAANNFGQLITSPDGITWTERTVPNNDYRSIAYGNGLFVAIANGSLESKIITTSPDGITWTSRTVSSLQTGAWSSITFGNGYFVAVNRGGSGKTMYSADGITWTSKASFSNQWESVTFANNRFVSVSSNGIGNNVMTLDVLPPPSTATLTLGTTKGSLNLNWTNGTCTILPSDVVQYEYKLYYNGTLFLTQILTRNSKSLDFQPAGNYYYTVDVIKNGTVCNSTTSNTVTVLSFEYDFDFSIEHQYGVGVITVNGSAPLPSYEAGTVLNISTTLGNGFTSIEWYDTANPNVILSSSPSFSFTMPSRGVRIFGVMTGTFIPTDDYGLKYFAEYGSIEGNCKRLEILKDGYNSALGTNELKVGEVTFGWGNQGDDPLKTIIGSYLDFELIGEDGDFDEFLLGDAKTFQVKYYENRTDTIPFFVGYISPDFITVLKTQTLQRYSFTAIDGLKALDAVRSNTAWQFTTADTAILGALNQEFPIARPVNYHANIWENRMNQSQNLFSQFATPYSAIFNEGRAIDFKDGERIVNERLKVSEVIQRLVNPFLCRVFLWRNEFYVTRIPDIISDPISEVDVTCIINNPEQTAHRVYTDYIATLKLASLDFSARGGVVDQIKSVDDWYIRESGFAYGNIRNLRPPWIYVEAIPSNRPKKRPETSTALIQYNEEFQSARIWTSTNQSGLADSKRSYMDFNTAFSGIGVAQETANTLSISFEYMAWPTTTVTATTLNNYRMAFRVKVGSYYLRKINDTQFDWTTTETDIVETIPGATVFHKYSISGMVVPEDGDVEVRFYQIVCVGGQAHLFSIDWKDLNINIEGNTSLSLAEKAVSAQTIDSFNNEHPEYVTHIGDAETSNSTSAIILTGLNEFSENWGRGGSESLPLLDLIVQDLANLKGRRNQRIRGTVERQEIKPYQLIEHNGEKFMVISIKLDTYRNRWECELFQLS